MNDVQFLRVVTGGKICPGLHDLRESIAFCKVFVGGREQCVAIGLKVDRPSRPILRIGGPK
jgi:hypothetical protein